MNLTRLFLFAFLFCATLTQAQDKTLYEGRVNWRDPILVELAQDGKALFGELTFLNSDAPKYKVSGKMGKKGAVNLNIFEKGSGNSLSTIGLVTGTMVGDTMLLGDIYLLESPEKKGKIIAIKSQKTAMEFIFKGNSALSDSRFELPSREAETTPYSNIADAVSAEDAEQDHPLTTIEFEETSHNFGKIPEGDRAKHTYYFKNTGQEDLYIYNVKPSCGCTAPEWSKEPVPPGKEGFITVEFDSKGKTGMQNKAVTVTANTEPYTNTVLTFSGEIVNE